MKYRTARDKEVQEAKIITVRIGNDEYRLSESIDGRLNINKINLGDGPNDSDYMRIHPRTGNEIEIS
jgi:hypothetical protein